MSKKPPNIVKARNEQIQILAYSGQGLTYQQIAEQVEAMGLPCSDSTVCNVLAELDKERRPTVDLEKLRAQAVQNIEAKIAELAVLKDAKPQLYYNLWIKYKVELHRLTGVRAPSRVDITVSKKPFQQMGELELLAALLDKLTEAQWQRVMDYIQSMEPEQAPVLEGEVIEKEEPLGLPKPHTSHHDND